MDTNHIITSKAPGRITFCGGGSDISPIPEKFGGACLNASINKGVTTRFRWRNDKKIVLHNLKQGDEHIFDLESIASLKPTEHPYLDMPIAVVQHFLPKLKTGFNLWLSSDVNLHSGLGTSASILTSLVGAFKHALHERFNLHEVAEIAFHLEHNILSHPTGRQDQYAAAFGGINFMNFKGGDHVQVNPVKLNRDTLLELQESLSLFFLMPRNAHPSGTIIKEHMKNFSGANARSVDAALKAKEFAVQSADALLAGNIKKFAELLDENWKVKKQFSTLVSNSAIDAFYEELKKQGAWGGKLLGAGGGGHMLVCSSPLDKTRIVNRATELGAHYIDFTFTFDGLTVWSKENHPELV